MNEKKRCEKHASFCVYVFGTLSLSRSLSHMTCAPILHRTKVLTDENNNTKKKHEFEKKRGMGSVVVVMVVEKKEMKTSKEMNHIEIAQDS